MDLICMDMCGGIRQDIVIRLDKVFVGSVTLLLIYFFLQGRVQRSRRDLKNQNLLRQKRLVVIK